MSREIIQATDDNIDDAADEQIRQALNLDQPKSFFLFAGAGSGKTRSLIDALKKIQENHRRHLRLAGQRVGVITYTNNARDEIKRRTEYNELIEVSTIHSFAWSLIGTFHADIRKWLVIRLQRDIVELEAAQAKGKAGSKAAMDRPKTILEKRDRISSLAHVKTFTYSPDGENRGRESLSHGEVIAIAADFLVNKPMMQTLLISRFPILLIDESQDTNKALMEALLIVQDHQKKHFMMGLFGDTMQRIYADGKADLGRNLPDDWAKPAKKMNHRSTKRIVGLINKIRFSVDGQEQTARSDAQEGLLKLFVLSAATMDKPLVEKQITERMAVVTQDALWTGAEREVKILILEHHMAARRMGFLEMYEPLYKNPTLRIGLLDGTLSGLRFFTNLILPIVQAKDDPFAIASVVRKNSPLLSKESLIAAGKDQTKQIQKARESVEKLLRLWDQGHSPNFLQVLLCVYETQLFELPSAFKLIASRTQEEQKIATSDTDMTADKEVQEMGDIVETAEIDAWDKFLAAPFNQVVEYAKYVDEKAEFDTHQGVKGLQFQRVMVIIDDNEARGFSFNYEKLFGVKDKTKDDVKNEEAGNETGIDRTRRLFYVTCSRAKKSLAIVAYSENPKRVRDHVVSQGWFADGEVELL